MNSYVTGNTIRQLREEKQMTQSTLAEKIGVSSKTVSKWETGKGLPDVALIQPLAGALGVSLQELLAGIPIRNRNVSGNMLRTKLYVCPICENVLYCTGEAAISCCGVELPPCEAEEADDAHRVNMEPVEDEIFVSFDHPMTKSHYISFVAYMSSDRIQVVKFYPEGNAETRLHLRGRGILYWYCNHHGLMKQRI